MAKSLQEQIDAVRRDDERIREAAARRADTVSKIVGPIAEKVGSAVRTRLEEHLRENLGAATTVDLSREGLKSAVDAFVASLTSAKKQAGEPKAQKAKPQASEPAKPAVEVPSAVTLE